ncbi:MAG TPA: hypothetical protein VGC22_09645, partial [Chitinophaga sp.]
MVVIGLCSALGQAAAQELHEYSDSVVMSSDDVVFRADLRTGTVSYRYRNGTQLNNTVAYVEDVHAGKITSADFATHQYEIGQLKANP